MSAESSIFGTRTIFSPPFFLPINDSRQWAPSLKSTTRLLSICSLLAAPEKSFVSWVAAPRTEYCCRYLSAHQHSQHLLCLSLHNYTSWSCFLSPPDHLFPTANLQSVPVPTLYSRPTRRVNLAVDMMLPVTPPPPTPRLPTPTSLLLSFTAHAPARAPTMGAKTESVNECDSVTCKVSELLCGSVSRRLTTCEKTNYLLLNHFVISI